MKDLYKLANAFLKASQVSQEAGPPSAGLKSEAPKDPLGHTTNLEERKKFQEGIKNLSVPQKIDPNIQLLLNQLGYPGALNSTGVLDANTQAALSWFKTKFGKNYAPSVPLLMQINEEVTKRKEGLSAHELAGLQPPASSLQPPASNNWKY